MQRYEIQTVAEAGEIANAPAVELSFCDVHFAPCPRTTAALVYLSQQGFICRMRCYETQPRAKIVCEDGDTYKDSCLEWFINFAPSRGEEYLNFEANSLGTLHCKYGKDRYVRHSLQRFSAPRPTAHATVLPDSWYVDYFISLETIRAVFGVTTVQSGDVFRGNFYKCGDETPHPHYGMWNPVVLETLDFHRPDFFGELVLL